MVCTLFICYVACDRWVFLGYEARSSVNLETSPSFHIPTSCHLRPSWSLSQLAGLRCYNSSLSAPPPSCV